MTSYEFYVCKYGGKAIQPDEWRTAYADADALIQRYERLYRVGYPTDSARDTAVCAIADAQRRFADVQSGAVAAPASVTIGSVSESYTANTAAAIDATPKALDEQGDAQMFHTKNVLRRVQKYMPYRTGATIKLTVAQTDPRVPEIVTEEPQAVYLYNDVSRSGKPLNYTKTKNPLAGGHWDRALVAAEGDALAADLERYIGKRSGE